MSVMERKRKVGSAEERGVKRRRLERDSLSPSSEGEISIHASYDDEFLESPSEHTRAGEESRASTSAQVRSHYTSEHGNNGLVR